MRSHKHLIIGVVVILFAILSCNLPTASNAPATQPVPNSAQPQAQESLIPSAAPSIPVEASATSTVAVTHLMTPADVSLTGVINYDVESQSNASLHRAPYGDVYRLNRLERPFTQTDMTYLPNVDIERFRITTDENWDYIFAELIGTNPNDPINIDYGVELDLNRDGFGDYLIWAAPPYSTTWTTNGVMVYSDSNHDSAGLSAEKSDAPFSGNGYDTVVFNQGQGQDPDLAWVRIDPKNSNVIEFAFKRTLPGKSFMWSVWADAGMRAPGKFSYNDLYTIEQAGSAQTDNLNYPIKALFAMDSTCRAAFGFQPNGYEPLLCPVEEVPTKKPGPGPTPVVCVRDPACAGCGYIWHQDTCTCEYLGPC